MEQSVTEDFHPVPAQRIFGQGQFLQVLAADEERGELFVGTGFQITLH